VRQRLGRINDAKEDFVQALKLGTNFTTEAKLQRFPHEA